MRTTESTEHWLRHRFALEADYTKIKRREVFALELNRTDIDFARTFGNRCINAYVGFLDLVGFSTRMHGKLPNEVYEYLNPFLTTILSLVNKHDGMVDKTIGDEIMFAFPHPDEDRKRMAGGPFDCCVFVKTIAEALKALPSEYPCRLGLSYGAVFIGRLESSSYAEWTLFGEPIHLAKRVMSIEALKSPTTICGAFAMDYTTSDDNFVKHLMLLSTWHPWDIRIDTFPGVGKLKYHMLDLNG